MGLTKSQIPLLGIIHQKVNSFWNLATRVKVSRCVLQEALCSSQFLEITRDERMAEKKAIAKAENPSPWWFLKGRRQMGERKWWLAECCVWFAQCDINLDRVTRLHPGYKGAAAQWHTSWDWLPQTQAPPRVWCDLPHYSPCSGSGPQLYTFTVKSLISLFCKYCKTLCFSYLISFSFLF